MNDEHVNKVPSTRLTERKAVKNCIKKHDLHYSNKSAPAHLDSECEILNPPCLPEIASFDGVKDVYLITRPIQKHCKYFFFL